MLNSLILAAALCGQAPQPQLWQLADSTGQVWQHADPAYLSRWVAERNARLAQANAVRYQAPAVNYYQLLWGSTCPNGACGR